MSLSQEPWVDVTWQGHTDSSAPTSACPPCRASLASWNGRWAMPRPGTAVRVGTLPGAFHPQLPKTSTAKSSPRCSQDLFPHGTRTSDPLGDPCAVSDQHWIVPYGHSDTTKGGWTVAPPLCRDRIPQSQHLLGGFTLISPARTPGKPPEIGNTGNIAQGPGGAANFLSPPPSAPASAGRLSGSGGQGGFGRGHPRAAGGPGWLPQIPASCSCTFPAGAASLVPGVGTGAGSRCGGTGGAVVPTLGLARGGCGAGGLPFPGGLDGLLPVPPLSPGSNNSWS